MQKYLFLKLIFFKKTVSNHFFLTLQQMDFHFKRLMRWWGKPYREYQLIKGDFLDQCHSEKLSSASVIFVNNCIFGPHLDQQLKG